MPILDIQSINGQTLGYDTDRGDWVPVDPNALGGSTVGNLGRAAGRGMESIGLGIQEAVGYAPEATQGAIADLAQRSQAASTAAPVAEAVGQLAPDVAAGVGLGVVTGGLGLAATMGTEAALNAALGGIRPGTTDERLTNALFQGAIGAAGGALGYGAASYASKAFYELYKPAGEMSEAATFGALRGAAAAEGVTTRQMSAINNELQFGARSIREAGDSGAGAGGLADSQLPGGGGRSAGAAETPAGAIDPRTQVESEIYAADDAAGMDVNNPQRLKDIKAAEDLGFTFNPGSYTKEGSGARTLEAINQAAPWREAQGLRNEAANRVLLNQNVAKAIGMKNWEQADVITPNDIGTVEADLSNTFEKITGQLPEMRNRDIQRALMDVDTPKGNAPSDRAEQYISMMIQNAEKNPAFIQPRQLMQDRSEMVSMKTKFFAEGFTGEGERMAAAIEALDKVIEKHVKAIGNRRVLHTWRDTRAKYRMLQQVQGPGVISPTNDVNATALFRNMNRSPSKGGYGNMAIQGMKKGDAVRDAYVLSIAQRINAPNRPTTGLMRIPSEAIKAATSKAGQAIGGGAVGGAVLNSIWGR
ncbi:MAG: hypothetical protein AAAC47_14800 [Pararhizobium sp.]